MNRKLIILGILFITGKLFAEAHSFVLLCYPKSYFVEMDLFLSSSFHYKIDMLWYIKMIGDDMDKIIDGYIIVKLAIEISSTFFYIATVFLFYRIADFFLLMWNFKQTPEIYWVFILCSIASVILIINDSNKNKMHIV